MHCSKDREKALTQKLESKEFLCPRAVTDTCMQCSGNRVNQTKLGITFEKSAFQNFCYTFQPNNKTLFEFKHDNSPTSSFRNNQNKIDLTIEHKL